MIDVFLCFFFLVEIETADVSAGFHSLGRSRGNGHSLTRFLSLDK